MNDADRRDLRRSQVIGIVVGLLGGAMSGGFWPGLREAVGWGGVLLWGAAIGAMLGSLSQFEKAGRLITRSDNKMLNLAVGICIPFLVIAALAFVLGVRS